MLLVVPRKILHIDMDAFFASVEQRDFPELKGLPVVVGGDRSRRGVVAAASYEARRFGVHSAMSMSEAYGRCPHLHRQPVRMSRYREVSSKLLEYFRELSALVEPLSIDEAFIDVTKTSRVEKRTATRLAYSLQQRIAEQLELSCSVGVAPNKFIAKIASDFEKPGGLTVVQPHEALDFLAPLPVRKVWGVGPSTASRMRYLGVSTIADLRRMSLRELTELFGRQGSAYYHLARGIDDRPVETEEESKSLSSEYTFPEDLADLERLSEALSNLAESVSDRARKSGLSGSTVTLKVRFSDFSTRTRSRTLNEPIRNSGELHLIGLELLENLQRQEGPVPKGVRLIGIGLSRLSSDRDPRQLELFSSEEW